MQPLNRSGFEPLDLRVLVLPDPAETKVGSILLPDGEVEKKEMAMTFGTLVAVGECAFSEAGRQARDNGASFTAPRPGDRVVFAKYGGIQIKGKDGEKYRLMNDEDIIGREQGI